VRQGNAKSENPARDGVPRLRAAVPRRSRTAFDQRRELRHPVYFLYFHTVELALKAFLFSCNVKPKGGHSLTALYEDCRKHGLIIGPYDQFNIGNIVSLLESGNRSQGFRYITQTSRSLPDFSWTREVVGELMEAVARHLGLDLKQKPVPGVAVRFDMVFSKPTLGKYGFVFRKPPKSTKPPD
jgi:hypothetical protein